MEEVWHCFLEESERWKSPKYELLFKKKIYLEYMQHAYSPARKKTIRWKVKFSRR
jgi:hypothetical protein